MEPVAGILIGLVVAIIALSDLHCHFPVDLERRYPRCLRHQRITVWQALGILILASILFGGHRVVNLYGDLPYQMAPAAPH